MIDRVAEAPAASSSRAAGAPAGTGDGHGTATVPAAAGLAALAQSIRGWGAELGFDAVRIADVDLSHAEAGLLEWLAQGFHGDMDYMANHGTRRARPAELVPGTVRAIVARMPYLPAGTGDGWRRSELARLDDPATAVISLYARGRDYHKVLRSRLQALASRIEAAIGPFGYRVFTDSAPVMEVALAGNGGLGWRGKHTLLLDRAAGSMFFLGEILVDIALPADPPEPGHCGQCRRCLDICPTQAILAPYRLDARRCISYLTIEHKGAIPEALRAPMGNRVYGCDDCQLACPWNKFARRATLPDFDVRNGFDAPDMAELFGWSEAEFNQRLEGSPIRRIGHERWLRNLAVGLGNSLRAASAAEGGDAALAARLRAALAARRDSASPLVREHIDWALAQDRAAAAGPGGN
ncbi:tRNA epoxyqueuosine(34) reductase QueG [Cupriavidus sp. USMAHM13]|uniref:Epoxyqueuosine reductase n=1 Tax=Cupriavidus malaysiensis TaxID=367825 RepID=A0ABM6F1P8_9BURK|nr:MULTISPECIES: tRNA epoxyqueuosine(34) reductase QueG [Cupriavidus]AOY98816.1 tRNA epoxyqueuosine(34) reductase QueG [Cupriavidus sp. USMAHM13]AOZ05240.1 tRNA epoxyqueuosine(34) reductase QueG [Cupriavidus malaysiensis]